MTVFVGFLAISLLCLFVSEMASGNKQSKRKAKGVLAVVLTLLYFPIGVIMALTKNYK